MLPDDMVMFFVEIAVMLSVALFFGQLARRLHCPAIIGELIGGIILGPTVLGLISPGAESLLFPSSGAVFAGRDALVQICLLFFLFFAGLEMNLKMLKKSRSGILWTSLLGIAIPFILGYGIVVLFPGLWGDNTRSGVGNFALFMGTALSISALPVIARILIDLDLMKSELAMLIMGSATINDLIGWSLFALILSNYASGSVLNLPPYMTLMLALLLLVFMVTIGRAIGQGVLGFIRSHISWRGVFLGITMVYVLLASALAELIGVHAVFGAFLVGIALSDGGDRRNEAVDSLYQFIMNFAAPLYFVSIGLQTDFLKAFDPLIVVVVLLVACIGKIVGATLGARIGGISPKQSVIVGFAMNTRGAMEVILATVARNAGIIDDRIFVALIIMAIVTSVISGPAIGLLKKDGLNGEIPPA
ncbi:MAG TPA: cation:proton antiporter [Methanocella sp.]|uniref:cation:proton antiporter n=1 Tax=Methanocella sp. TaxID=2052833 RepID=UPI002B794718|nr:cation:proton antiporter [Methanocella sp.]HTY90913.1 cation:proton antiporter [Methanocella sp.]